MRIPTTKRYFVGGNWIDAIDGERLPVEIPFDRSVVAYVPRARARDVDRSVAAAAAAFPGWRQVLPRERGRALIKIADAIEKEIEQLARLLATETGNALRTQARPKFAAPSTSFATSADWAASSGQHFALRRGCAELYAPGVDWRRWRHHRLECARGFRRQDCAGSMRGQYDRPQNGRGRASHRAGDRGDCAGFLAGRHAQRSHRARRRGRRRAAEQSPRPEVFIYRIDGGWKAGVAGGCAAHRAGFARAWRENPCIVFPDADRDGASTA